MAGTSPFLKNTKEKLLDKNCEAKIDKDGEDNKGNNETNCENRVRFENFGSFFREKFRHHEKQAEQNANRLQRRQQQAIEDGTDFYKLDRLKAKGINDDHTCKEKDNEKKSVFGFPGEFIGDRWDTNPAAVGQQSWPAGQLTYLGGNKCGGAGEHK